jgi:hypothetical protein
MSVFEVDKSAQLELFSLKSCLKLGEKLHRIGVITLR